MKYSKEERLAIGRRIFEKEINRSQAALEYDIDIYTARDYMRLYKASLKMEEGAGQMEAKQSAEKGAPDRNRENRPYEEMTKTELLREIRRLEEELQKKQ